MFMVRRLGLFQAYDRKFLKLLINFVLKFLGTVRFENDHVAAILGFGDLQWGNILITRVYFVEVLGHNLFSVGHFCDSDLEVAFRRNACFIRNLEGVDLLSGNRTTNLYTINLHEMASASPICLMARASSTKSWLWHQRIATVCFTQNCSIIHRRFNKTPYELINGRKPDISFLYVFGALCYPKNDREDIGKLGAKGDIGFFIGYSANSCAYRVYNRRIKKIMEIINVSFDELSAMDFEQRSLKPGLQSMTSGQITMYDDYIGGQPSSAQRTVLATQAHQVNQTLTTSTSIADTTPTPTNSSSKATNFPNTLQDVDELNSQQQHFYGSSWKYPKDRPTAISQGVVRRLRLVPTEMELVLEQSQKGSSHEVSVSTEGVEELKRIVRIKSEKKETLHTTLGRNQRSTRFYWLSHSEIIDIEKVTVHSSLRVPNNKCALKESSANEIHQKSHQDTNSNIQDVVNHDGVEVYDSDCDDVPNSQPSFMANISSSGSDVLPEVPDLENMDNNMINQGVQTMPSSEQSSIVNHLETEITSNSNIIPYSHPFCKPTKVEVLKELPKINMVVEQHLLESKTFEVKMNKVLNENERLLKQVINKDTVNIIINSTVDNASVNVHECEKCLKLKTELLSKKSFIKKETYDKLFRSYTTLEKHCISLEVDTQLNQEIFQRDNSVSNQSAPSFDQYFELNELKAQLQEKDTVIKKLRERIKSLNGNMNEDKIKKDIEEIKTINIELDQRVSKLIAENEQFEQTYKQLYDSIKPTHIQSKEYYYALIAQINAKSVENSDLNAQLQEKVLAITALKE
nr:integrase, catalytic region, zinc finger, CCHC-type, peptidase aspartic, catalytic [Tanacetum cinerariifolium]